MLCQQQINDVHEREYGVLISHELLPHFLNKMIYPFEPVDHLMRHAFLASEIQLSLAKILQFHFHVEGQNQAYLCRYQDETSMESITK